MYTLKANLTSPHTLSAKFEDLHVKNPHDGATFYPFVSEDGVISWTNDKELENPSPVNIKGEKGNNGYTPVKGVDYWTSEDKETIVEDTVNSDEIKNIVEAVETATDIAEKAEFIAKGKATGYVFDTFEDMQLWLTDEANVGLLNLGDNLYIRAVNVPDYWWDGNEIQQLETQKVDLSDYVKNTDYATPSKYGVVKVESTNGTGTVNGLLSIIRATNDEIKAKKQEHKPIVPSNLDYAVKQAMNPVEPWNAEEQAAGRNTLGLKSEKWTFTLEDGTVIEKEVAIL